MSSTVHPGPPNSDPLHIRTVTSVEDCRRVQTVQARIWRNAADDIVPIHVLITQAKNGGLIQGAFAADGPEETGRLVGFAFGWPGFGQDADSQPQLKFCSHIVGVLPDWHGQGIGLQLKLAQRQELLRQGWTDRVTWTYDPLQRVNGRLNIHRLGGISRTYLRNVYGEMNDSLNAGMPTDRFQVDWHLSSPRVEQALAPDRQPRRWDVADLQRAITRPVQAREHLRQPVAPPPQPDGRPYALPLPDSVDGLRRASDILLLDWRLFIREAVESCLAAGYALVDCVPLDGEWHYILEKVE